MKCYTHALRYDKDNLQIIRDFSMLQMQMRNYEGLVETRQQLLRLKPSNRMNWVGLAMAYHLLNKHETALNVMASYDESLGEALPGTMDYEASEILLYRNLIMEEMGDFEKALKHLEEFKSKIIDQKAFSEAKGRLLLKAGKLNSAEKVYEALVRVNPDNQEYVMGLLQSKGLKTSGNLSDSERQSTIAYLEKLGKQYPRSHLLRRLPLAVSKGDQEEFVKLADAYLQTQLRKGVPSLFVSLKSLYTDSTKAAAIEKLVQGYLELLQSCSKFSPNAPHKEPPTAFLWVSYFLAQHYDWKKNYTKALECVNTAMEHTPSLVELYMVKARILKHAGDLQQATDVINLGRELDLQDRYINSKCTKYMLRSGRITEAENTITMFTRSESTDPLADLVEMQCMWFALESGQSHCFKNELGKALKKFHQIEKHFVEIYDDQFDFHSYCMRKMTLRSYLGLLRFEDEQKNQKFYVDAALNATKIYMDIFDDPSLASGGKENLENLSAAERKKLERKARKAELKESKDNNTSNSNNISNQQKQEQDKKSEQDQKSEQPSKPKDDDPNGLKLLKTTDPLNEAAKLLRPVMDLNVTNPKVYVLGSELYTRKKKFVLALKYLKKAFALDATNADAHAAAVRFFVSFDAAKAELDAIVRDTIQKELTSVFGGVTDMVKFNTAFVEKHKSSLAHVFAGVKAAQILKQSDDKVNALFDQIAKLDGGNGSSKSMSLAECRQIIKFVKNVRKDEKRGESLKATFKKWYPLCPEF